MPTRPRTMETGSAAQKLNCVCSKYNFGRPHLVSTTTWYRHLQEAGSEEEWQQIHAAKLDDLPANTRRPRGIAIRRHNNTLPTNKRGRELDRESIGPQKRSRQEGSLQQVCIRCL